MGRVDKQVILRQWKGSDLEPFAAMNSDPEVMHYFPMLLTREESAASMDRARARIEEHGWGWWAVEVDGVFAGFTGLAEPRFTAHFTPCVEIGWRLRREFWGQGIAFEAAQQAMKYAFSELKLSELVSFTAAVNLRSRKLMERLGFSHEAVDDFDHPEIAEGHWLRRHVLYRKRRNRDVPPLRGFRAVTARFGRVWR
jgi:RimJ/RimL family protein N-acetyltransferase